MLDYVVKDRSSFVVDTDALSQTQRVHAARLVIELLAPHAASFECDIPWSQKENWPTAVRAAAEHLSSLKRPGRSENELYRQTGILKHTDESVWSSFVTFAPYAYDASVWRASFHALVELADEGQSIVVSMTNEEVDITSNALGERLILPLKEGQKRR